jgi:hypothetical protein
MSARRIVYAIDRNDIITRVGGAWTSFATANGCPELADSVLGTRIQDHVTGPEINLLWDSLLHRARTGHPVTVPYRCDSPTERRFLQMTLRRGRNDAVEFASDTLRVESRPYRLLLAPPRGSADTNEGMIRACSWCRRFDVHGWVEVEEAVSRLDLLNERPPRVTHVLCEDCERTVRGSIEPAGGVHSDRLS